MRQLLLSAVALVLLAGLTLNRSHASSFILAGEPVWLDARKSPEFTANQIQHSTEATRNGLARWAATAEGRRVLGELDRSDFRIEVLENEHEESPGRAPQPALATLIAASDRHVVKSYMLILNPNFGVKGFHAVPGHPYTPSEIMATAWAAEMLHIYFYAHGISLPHHRRADFQEAWRSVAIELGFPAITHRDDSDEPQPGAQVVVW